MVLWRSKQKLDMQSTGYCTSGKRSATMRHKGLQRTVMTCEMQLLASIIALTSYICQATFILTFGVGEWKPFLFLLQNQPNLENPKVLCILIPVRRANVNVYREDTTVRAQSLWAAMTCIEASHNSHQLKLAVSGNNPGRNNDTCTLNASPHCVRPERTVRCVYTPAMDKHSPCSYARLKSL